MLENPQNTTAGAHDLEYNGELAGITGKGRAYVPEEGVGLLEIGATHWGGVGDHTEGRKT